MAMVPSERSVGTIRRTHERVARLAHLGRERPRQGARQRERHEVHPPAHGLDRIGGPLKALVCERKAQKANEEAANGRYGERQDNEPALTFKSDACRRRDK